MRIYILAAAAVAAGVAILSTGLSEGRLPSATTIARPPLVASKQVNLIVLLDLSDRVKLKKGTPNQPERDKAIVQSTAEWFKSWIQKKGAFGAHGCYSVVFEPYPMGLANLSEVSESMHYDLTGKGIRAKDCQEAYHNIVPNTKKGVSQLYEYVIKQPFEGADILGFAKDKLAQRYVRDPAIYRNVLVLVTDGYIDHIKAHAVPPQANKTAYINDAYITQKLVKGANFTAANWQAKYAKGKYGLQVPAGVNLKGMEVLVLGINAYNRPDFYNDIIKCYVTDWLKAMGASRVELYKSDLESTTHSDIKRFLGEI